jgi:hypothetical protein
MTIDDVICARACTLPLMRSVGVTDRALSCAAGALLEEHADAAPIMQRSDAGRRMLALRIMRERSLIDGVRRTQPIVAP